MGGLVPGIVVEASAHAPPDTPHAAEIFYVGDHNPSVTSSTGWECWQGPPGPEIEPPGQPPITNLRGCYIQPAETRIHVGETVKFTGASYYSAHKGHCFGPEGGLFCDTGPIGAGNFAKWTFTAGGTYRLACAFHPEMTGTLIVEP